MEKQIVTITIITEGEKCDMRDNEIVEWYHSHIAGLFNPEYGKPQISVRLDRKEFK